MRYFPVTFIGALGLVLEINAVARELGVLFTSGNKNVNQRNSLIWFEKWVCQRQTLDYLSKKSGYNERTLRRMFNAYLNSYTQWKIPVDKSIHVLIDVTFTNKLSLIIYPNAYNTLESSVNIGIEEINQNFIGQL